MSFCLIVLVGWVFPPVSDPLPNGTLDRRTLKSHLPSVLWAKPADRLQLIPVSADRSLLRVTYPARAWGSKESGAQIMFALPPTQTATAQYRVRFAENFDFVKGGKLPGLAGGTATTGNKRPTGDGWSARFMWRSRGDAVLYLYHLDQRKQHGDDFRLDVRFIPGKWHVIKQRVTLNRAEKKDGRIEVWFDGDLVLDQSSLRLRSADQAMIDRYYFSTFFGGSGDEWAPNEDQTIDFADFEVQSTN